ncbi:Myb/SANT-like DNA-binding domain-containing protein [Biscogniauxia mediterranea]|nr:Myb/SANT-like DNA-binding domain-containing protein [Biscogniauxia mediterranea]
MSDEDVEITAARTTSRRNADRRTPRFSWNLAYEETFFRSLCESMQMGYKENHSFKSGAWERAAIALRDKHNAYPEKSHLINKADNARKKFRMWRGLREDPEFLYNPSTRMVTASEEAWRRHFEKEPLSKALRGRPFDHEEYMEILFPDVVGSGGAPKRIMKPRRKNPDGTPVGRPSNVEQQPVIDPSLDSSIYTQSPLQNSTQQPMQQPAPQQPHIPTPSVSQSTMQTAIPPASSIPAASNALTPPEEHAPNSHQARKRPHHPDPAASSYAEKRRGRPSRFSSNFYNQQSMSTPTSSAPAPPSSTPRPTASASHGIHSSFSNNSINLAEDGSSSGNGNNSSNNLLSSLAEILKSSSRAAHQPQPPPPPPPPQKWPEQAVEIFFREFADEDADLQLKIAEKALTDENKAMVFVKMPPPLRRHWVGRLRDVHMRNLGGGGLGGIGGIGIGIGGRVGEEGAEGGGNARL